MNLDIITGYSFQVMAVGNMREIGRFDGHRSQDALAAFASLMQKTGPGRYAMIQKTARGLSLPVVTCIYGIEQQHKAPIKEAA